MKNLTVLTLSLFTSLSTAFADNTVKTVSQVAEAVTLSDDVDYHITSDTPFTTSGSVNIKNTDHAVLVFDKLKPSLALKQLGFVTINGEAAKNGVNCQVKIYNRGAIIMPYAADIKPLTVYSEPNFKGESVNDFGLENTGGYMNTLTDAKLNNRIQSFKLKRGYMVTFATGKKGYGYSRCFIADKADLEMNLPSLMANRVSSYRIFKWNDCSKAGLASDTGNESNVALNTQSCYDWGTGRDMGIDREAVANHIYEDWPSAADCGKQEYSPMMKTNNEPGNSADDHPQSVETVLANWENLMATGKRLCSPSSHDGSLGWLREFIDSIDARGWRCDIMDVHCYWPEGSFNNLSSWYSNYGNRPLWISEWVWGASWNNNGVFTSGWDDSYRVSQNAVVVKRILDKLNSWGYVERYFYWNGEQWYSKIYNDGALTPTGEYYATMETGVGYKSEYNKYVPKGPRMGAPSGLKGTFNSAKRTYKLSWSEPNGEFNKTMELQRKLDNGAWTTIANIDLQDTKANYTYNDTLVDGGKYLYRVRTVDYLNKERFSGEENYSMSVATKVGNGDMQYGSMTVVDKNKVVGYLYGNFEEKPAVLFSSVTNKNSKASLIEHLSTVTGVSGAKNSVLGIDLLSWTAGKTADAEMKVSETYNFMAVKPGNGTIGTLGYESGLTKKRLAVGSSNAGQDTAVITFAKPFKDVPVVLASPHTYGTATNVYPVSARVFDVTNKGFKIKLMRQAVGLTGFRDCQVSYLAMERGQVLDGNGHIVTVRDTTITFKNAASTTDVYYGDNSKLANPVFFTQLQTMDTPVLAVLRQGATGAGDYSTRVRLQIDDTDPDNGKVSSTAPFTARVGYIVMADAEGSESTGIKGVAVAGISYSEGVYNMNGVKIANNIDNLPKGIYIIKKNGKSQKVVKN